MIGHAGSLARMAGDMPTPDPQHSRLAYRLYARRMHVDRRCRRFNEVHAPAISQRSCEAGLWAAPGVFGRRAGSAACAYSGMLSCFFAGLVATFVFSVRSARTIRLRVLWGMMTSSM